MLGFPPFVVSWRPSCGGRIFPLLQHIRNVAVVFYPVHLVGEHKVVDILSLLGMSCFVFEVLRGTIAKELTSRQLACKFPGPYKMRKAPIGMLKSSQCQFSLITRMAM